MTTPLQIIQVPGIGEELQKAIGPLLEAYQRRRQLELNEEELKQRKAESKQRADERKAEQDMLAQQGELLRGMLLLQEGQMQDDALTSQGVVSPEPGAPQLGGTSHHPNVQGLANALAPPPLMAAPSMSALAQLVRNTPAVALPGAVQLSTDIRRQLLEQRAATQADAAIQSALTRIPNVDVRADFAAYAQMRRSGAEIPVDMARQLFPRLFPTGVDPETMNSALRYGVAGGLNWGQIRSLFSIPPTSQVPDDFRFPITLGGRQTEKQLTGQMHYLSMSFNAPIIDQLVEETGGISALAQLQRSFEVSASTGGGISGFFATLAADASRGLLSPEQQQLVDAHYRFANSYRYLVSGQQTSDKEFRVVLNTVAERFGDSQEAKGQKKAFRQLVTEAARRLAAGEIGAVAAATKVLGDAQSLNMPPELIEVLRTQLEDAKKLPAQGAPPLLTRDPADAQQQQITDALILQLIMGATPQVQP